MNAALEMPVSLRTMLLSLLALAMMIAASCSYGAAPQQGQTEISGEWWTPGYRARVRIERGRQVLFDLRRSPRGDWRDGHAFNPDDGNTYAAALRRLDADRIVVEGCLLFLCREQVWLRVAPGTCAPLQWQTSRHPLFEGPN